FPGGGADVFVDEAHRPVGRQIRCDQQQSLRRHETLDAIGQRIGVLERAKRRRVSGKHEEDPPYRLKTFCSHQTSSSILVTCPPTRNLTTSLKARLQIPLGI